MTDLIIRPATAADIPEIAAIYSEAVIHGTASFELEPPLVAEMERRRAELEAHGHPYLVGARSGRVLGYAYAGPYRARPAYRWTVEDSIYIDREARGMRLGSALLSALIERSGALGFRQMIAVIGDSASTASIALHRSAGFEHIGTFANIGHKHGRWLDTVLMQRALGPGAGSDPV